MVRRTSLCAFNGPPRPAIGLVLWFSASHAIERRAHRPLAAGGRTEARASRDLSNVSPLAPHGIRAVAPGRAIRTPHGIFLRATAKTCTLSPYPARSCLNAWKLCHGRRPCPESCGRHLLSFDLGRAWSKMCGCCYARRHAMALRLETWMSPWISLAQLVPASLISMESDALRCARDVTWRRRRQATTTTTATPAEAHDVGGVHATTTTTTTPTPALASAATDTADHIRRMDLEDTTQAKCRPRRHLAKYG